MNRPVVCCALLLSAALAFAAGPPPPTGAIEGVVRYTGVVPPARKLATMDGVIVHRDLIVDGKTKGARDVVLCLADAPVRPKLTGGEPAYIDQKDMVFQPRVVAVQHGRAVRFDNNDPCNHSVVTASTVRANNLNIFVPQGKPIDHNFEAQRHPLQVGCSLHAWMRAWVYVFPHPWFAVSDAKGTFRITSVPPGKYSLWLRHADTGWQEKRVVEVRAGRTTRVDVEWKAVP